MSKISLLFIVLFFLFTAIDAQNAEKKMLTCFYDYSFQKDTTNFKYEEDILFLQIDGNISKFGSYYSFISDSLFSTSEGRKVWRELFKKAIETGNVENANFPYRRLSTYITKYYQRSCMTIFDHISTQGFTYQDSLNNQNWQLLDSTKEFLNYKCQKAECDFRGRHWTAWFTEEIPVNDGPWKFSGLPGLILEAYDTGMQYKFIIRSIEHNNKDLDFEKYLTKKYIKTNRTDFLKSMKRYLNDTPGYNKIESDIDISSSSSQSKEIKYDLIERY